MPDRLPFIRFLLYCMFKHGNLLKSVLNVVICNVGHLYGKTDYEIRIAVLIRNEHVGNLRPVCYLQCKQVLN